MKRSKKIKIFIIPILALSLVLNLTLPVAAVVTDPEDPAYIEVNPILDPQSDDDVTEEEENKEAPGEKKEEYNSEDPGEDEEKADPEDFDEENTEEDEPEEIREESGLNESEDLPDGKIISEEKDVKVTLKATGLRGTALFEDPLVKSEEKTTTEISFVSAEWINEGQNVIVNAEIKNTDDTSDLSAQVFFQGKAQAADINGNTVSKSLKISSTQSKEYEVYFVLSSGTGEVIGESEHITVKKEARYLLKTDFRVTDSADDENTGIIEYIGNYDFVELVYRQGNSSEQAVDGGIISGLGRGTYTIIAPAYQEGYTYYTRTTATLDVKNGGTSQYAVRTSGDKNVSFDKTVQSVKKGNDVNIYIRPVDDKTHYIDESSIKILPEDKFNSFSYYSLTGELTITGISGDITVYASSKEKATVSSLSVKSVSFNENGNYSEQNPSIQTKFKVEALDKDGNPVPNAKLYFRDDINGTSYTNSRSTDENGVAEFTHSYSVNRENSAKSADYTPVFGTDVSFDKIKATTDIHLVLQLKDDLVLYTDQIIGTKPEQNDGKIINVSEGYEIWTGDVHDGYLVVGSGKWEKIVNGEASGLSSGWHALRAGAKIDGNTYYFASDWALFEVPRGAWDISIDKTGSENVIFTGNDVLTTEPGGTVYVYLKPAEGFNIDSFSVNKPNYVSGRIYYSKDNGYLVIEGVTGSLILTVKAVKVPANTSAPGPYEKTGVTEDNNTNVTEPDQTDQVNNDSNDGNDELFETVSLIPAAAPAQIPFVLLNADNPVPGGAVLSARVPRQTTASSVQKKAFYEIADEIVSEKSVSPETAKTKEPVKKEIEKPADTKTIEDQAVALSGSIDVESDLKEGNMIWVVLLILLLVTIITGAYVIQKQKGKKSN